MTKVKLSALIAVAFFAVPEVERVVYSTCSVHQAENEDVVKSVLPFATSLDFKLETPFPDWPRRGLPVFDGCKYLCTALDIWLFSPFLLELIHVMPPI